MPDLQGRELDAKIAVDLFGTEVEWFSATVLVFRVTGVVIPNYSTSHNAVALVRAEIERRGLERQFLSEMIAIVGYTEWTAWRSMNATPEQQCRAALKTVEGAR